jgi:hypothetical protein
MSLRRLLRSIWGPKSAQHRYFKISDPYFEENHIVETLKQKGVLDPQIATLKAGENENIKILYRLFGPIAFPIVRALLNLRMK